ncbi:RNA binding protein, putative [Ricinus communis]|uniref:RNA binding protein, putative n=2 Tax=Ricinus communis TaxID=3988 RepID=B9SN50_RICCO|nr:RNA binding protein, putative [Ricinus communis]
MHSLNGVKFDPQSGSTLHIELARSNSRRVRKPGSGAYVVIDKRTQQASNAQETSSDYGGSDSDETAAPAPAPAPAPTTATDNTDSANQGDLMNVKSEPAGDPDNASVLANESEKTAEGGVHPCSTLFIANLGPNCTEDELRHTLSQYPGFNVLKMRAKGGMPVAFADFEEIEQAIKAMEDLQGTLLPSSDRGGMHIEYARSKMRKP